VKNELSGVTNKIMNILEIFLKHERPLSISEMASLTGLNVSTAHRIASTLVDYDYLRQDGKRGKYTIGLKFLKFNNVLAKNFTIKDIALPFLEKLQAMSGESANLAIMDKNEIVYIEHIEASYSLRTFTAVGNRAPLYCTGVGKIFLANMSEEQLASALGKPLTRYTDNTITDIEEMKKELSVIKREGISIDKGEMENGVRCIASPIFDSNNNVIAAISISGPYLRLTNTRVDDLKNLVKENALEISRIIGYSG
jgi:IclR family transcriptional regulator, KDG regulon repressor